MVIAEGTIYMTHQLTTDILNAALAGLTSKRQQIYQQIGEVRRLLAGSRNGASAGPASARRKRRISAAGRRAIAAAQKRRWAEKKAAAVLTPATEKKRPKRKLSRAGRAAIVAALKKRWAAQRAEGSKSRKATAKVARTRPA